MSDGRLEMTARTSWVRRVIYVSVPLGVVVAIIAACGSSDSDHASDGTRPGPGTGQFCGTPNDGCPCDKPGENVECGVVEIKSGDYVSCSMGRRTCIGTTWGPCLGTNVVTKHVAGGSSLHGLALGAGVPCPPPPSPLANACDPYCNNYVDDPLGLVTDSGLVVIDGGLTIPPNGVDAGDAGITGGGPPIFTTGTGLNTCAGSADEITNPCAGNPNKNCQQDFHCDTVANQCVWNEPSLYVDPTCNGVDLTIGTGCDQGASYLLPVCNRGTKTLSAGANIKIGITNSGGFNAWNAACGGGTPVSCNFTITSPLGPGQCTTTTACPGGAGQTWAIVNADNSIPECNAPGAKCTNNSAQIKNGGAGCATCACNSGAAEVTGTILDPAKLRPVFGATLYVPSSAVTAFTAGVGCDTCTNVYSGLPALASTTTDVDGKFRLQGVPAGVSFPVVLQLGRFRRQFMVASIAPCATAVLPAANAHLPATQTKVGDTAADTVNPDLPKIAMVTGSGDATECLLARMGIATSEFTNPAGTGAIHMYSYTGLSGVTPLGLPGSTVAGAGNAYTFLASAATLNQYNALIMPCANGTTNSTAAMQTSVRSWLDAGGRLFASHIAVEEFIHLPAGNPNDNVATWSSPDLWGSSNPDQSDRAPTYSLTDTINQSFPYGAAMARWMPIAWPAPGGPGGAPPPAGTLPLPNYRNNVKAVAATTTNWFGGTSNYAGAGNGPQMNMISFDAPVANPPATQCGRAVLPFMHVSSNSSGTFPASCGAVPNALTGQELAFEYMMWQSMTCLSPSTLPPTAPAAIPPGPPAPLAPITFTRDYFAGDPLCAPGTHVTWQFFYWQASVPPGTQIDFRGATADTQLALPGLPPPAAPTSVPVGTASVSILAPTWGQDARTVDDHLRNDPTVGAGTPSKAWLRVYMTFNPSGNIAPSLLSWRQTYDCVPIE
jgi:hypothetical protein